MQGGRRLEVATPAELQGRGTDTVHLRLADPPATTPTFDLEAVESVDLDGDRLTVRASNGGRTAPRLVAFLEAAGHEVVDLDIVRTSLEDVFVEMTAGGTDRGGDPA